MTNPTQSKPTRAALEGMSKARRTALCNLSTDWQRAPSDGYRRSGHACSSLVKIGLAERSAEDCGIFYRLTAAGSAAQSALRARAASEDTDRG